MNWLEFLDNNQIDYTTRGPNTRRGECSIKCPWCGEDDPSTHLGISLTTENWGCLRNPMHRGHSAPRLVMAVLGCSSTQASLIVRQYSHADPGTLDAALNLLTGTSEAPKPADGLFEPLPDFRAIKAKGSTAKFWRYLEQRGFDDVAALATQYQLRCCLTGRFQARIIIPFHQGGGMIAWTGRAITDPIHAARYLSSKRVKETIFNEDTLMGGGELLFVVEGPFDALKLDYYGQQDGARATCVFGTHLSVDQVVILSTLRKRFDKIVVLFDQGAIEPAFLAMDWLQAGNVMLGHLPEGVKDPGAMTAGEIEAFIKSLKNP